MVKKCIRLTCMLAFLCLAMNTAMLAADNIYLYLVRGIPGRDDTTTTDPQFPVDVLVNDEVCYVRGLTFGSNQRPADFCSWHLRRQDQRRQLAGAVH